MVVDGIEFGEGPVWCEHDATLVVTSVTGGCLWRVWPEAGRRELFADTDGGANGATPTDAGGFLVTNNGGVDLTETGVIENPPPPRLAPPGLQHVSADGKVTYLARDGLRAPNDLCVGDDGVVYFTDPGHFPPPKGEHVGRVMAYDRDGTCAPTPTASGTATASRSISRATWSSSSAPACSASIPTAPASG